MTRVWLCLVLCGICSACNPGFTQLANGRCYRIVGDYLNYNSSEQTCERLDAKLASVHSSGDNTAIANFLTSNGVPEAWIGLTCVETTPRQYAWTDGSVLDFTHFAASPPDVSNGDSCFFLKTGISGSGVQNAWYPQHCQRFSQQALCEQTVTQASCGDYAEYNSACYKAKTDPLSWQDAELDCVREGGHLVAIHDPISNQDVYSLLRSSGVGVAGWIGLRFVNQAYVWTDQSPLNYDNKATPANGSPFAMSVVQILYPQQWIPESRDYTLPYVCQRPKSVNPYTVQPPTETPGCGPSEFCGYSGQINSPDYPAHFSGAGCYYYITGNSGAVNLNVPAISADLFWSLSIYEGTSPSASRLIYEITSNDAPHLLQYSSPTSEMYIYFTSQAGSNGAPFSMTWTSTQFPQYPTGYLGSTYMPPTSVYPTRSIKCDEHWLYDDNRDICIGFTQGLEYGVARALCSQYSSHLLSVHSLAEEQNILAILDNIYYPSGYKLWIGATFEAGGWFWDDASSFSYSDFVDNDRSNANGNCLSINYIYGSQKRGWQAADCSLNLQGICFKRAYAADSQRLSEELSHRLRLDFVDPLA